jgi:hypothetical protein
LTYDHIHGHTDATGKDGNGYTSGDVNI